MVALACLIIGLDDEGGNGGTRLTVF